MDADGAATVPALEPTLAPTLRGEDRGRGAPFSGGDLPPSNASPVNDRARELGDALGAGALLGGGAAAGRAPPVCHTSLVGLPAATPGEERGTAVAVRSRGDTAAVSAGADAPLVSSGAPRGGEAAAYTRGGDGRDTVGKGRVVRRVDAGVVRMEPWVEKGGRVGRTGGVAAGRVDGGPTLPSVRALGRGGGAPKARDSTLVEATGGGDPAVRRKDSRVGYSPSAPAVPAMAAAAPRTVKRAPLFFCFQFTAAARWKTQKQ